MIPLSRTRSIAISIRNGRTLCTEAVEAGGRKRLRVMVTAAASAVGDLEAIRTWYADQQVPDVGERLLKRMIALIERPNDFSESGRVVPEFKMVNLRKIIHPPFRIVYRLDANKIRVVRVWCSERLLKIE
jgi:toxin ParE1/3/4